MIRGTTPTLTFTFSGITLADMEDIYVTIKQGTVKLDKVKDDMILDTDKNTASVKLTQEETLEFKSSTKAYVQVRVKTANGIAAAGNIMQMDVDPILKEGGDLMDNFNVDSQTDNQNFGVSVSMSESSFDVGFGSGYSGGGTDNYEKLNNIPYLDDTKIIGTIHEKDPTVPDWAKASKKPTYNPSEVGAVSEASAIALAEIDEMFNI